MSQPAVKMEVTEEATSRKRKRSDANAGAAAASASSSSASPISASASASPLRPSTSSPSSSSLLIASQGANDVRHGLSSSNPHDFITKFQAEHGWTDPATAPALSFLDLFVSRRAPLYSDVLTTLTETLDNKIKSSEVDKERQLQLLDASFPYLGVEELAPIPITLMQSLIGIGALPSRFKRALVEAANAAIEAENKGMTSTAAAGGEGSRSIINRLPLDIRRLIMEADPEKHFWNNTHIQHALKQYASDSARIDAYTTLLPVEHMIPMCKRIRAAQIGIMPASSPSAAQSILSSSPAADALQTLLDWIGPSKKLYNYTCTRLRQLVMDGEGAQPPHDAQVWKSLRVDLLMRLHQLQFNPPTTSRRPDMSPNSGGFSSPPAAAASSAPSYLPTSVDSYHAWCWCLDAGLTAGGVLSFKLLERIHGSQEELVAQAKAKGRKGKAAAQLPTTPTGFLPTFVRPKRGAQFTLLDLSMLAGHPFMLLSLMNSVIQCLNEVVEKEITPAGHGWLHRLLPILQLALTPANKLAEIGARMEGSGNGSGVVGLQLPDPEPAEAEMLWTSFLPALTELIVYAQLGEMEPLSDALLQHACSSTSARSLLLFYLLTRIQAKDTVQTAALLPWLPLIKDGTQEDAATVWEGAAGRSDDSLLNGILHTATSLIIDMKPTLVSDSSFRQTALVDCFLPLSLLSPFAHRETIRLMAALADEAPQAEMQEYISVLQSEGSRLTEPETKAEAQQAVVTHIPSDINKQIGEMYDRFFQQHPSLQLVKSEETTAPMDDGEASAAAASSSSTTE